MNIRDLKYLVAIADHGHFGAASEACFVSQPALSMQLKKLEEILGVTLIERTNKSVLLTDIGRVIVDEARTILQRVQHLQDLAHTARDPFSGVCRFGVIPTLAPYVLPIFMPALSKQFPKLDLYLIEEKTAVLTSLLSEGKIDAALLALPFEQASCHIEPLFQEEFYLAVPKKHRLAAKSKVHTHELKDHRMLLLEDGHCLRNVTVDWCERMQVQENASFRCSSLETLRHMVASGVGMTLLPKFAKRDNDSICYRDFAEPKPCRDVGLVWRASSAKKVLLAAIAQQIKKCMDGV